MKKTKRMLLYDRNIWDSGNDPAIREVTQNIMDKIESVNYASKGIIPTKAATNLMTLVSS